MLAQKKLAGKKLIIYGGIIAVMLGGTAFMLYQNKKLTSPIVATVDDPTMYQNIAPAVATPLPESTAPAAAAAPASPDQTAAANQLKNSGGLDLTIFESDKFKQLKANQPVNQIQAEVGKRDPFQPN